MSAATVYLISASAYTPVAAWGWLSAKQRRTYKSLVVEVTLGAVLLWVAYGVTS